MRQVSLRLATDNDIELVMAWRSHPLVYEGTYTQKTPLTWVEHLAWWRSRNQDWREFIITLTEDGSTRRVGILTLCQLDHWSPEMGVILGETTLWRQGVAKEAVLQGLQWLGEYGKNYCHTTIKWDNMAAARLAESVGFQKFGEARPGESWYQICLKL